MTAASVVLTELRASGLSVGAQAFLAAVIEGETPQSAGQGYSPWNILYSGAGSLTGTAGLVDQSDASNILMVGNLRYWSGSLATFPTWHGGKLASGNLSTAAGGGQVTRTTFNDYAAGFGITAFDPQAQIEFCWKLANVRYPQIGTILDQAATNSAVLAMIPAMLGKTWPGGCDSGFPKRYAANLAALQAPAPPPQPPPEPEAVTVAIQLPTSLQGTDEAGRPVSVAIKWVTVAAASIALMLGAAGLTSKADGDFTKPPGIFATSTFRLIPGPLGPLAAPLRK